MEAGHRVAVLRPNGVRLVAVVRRTSDKGVGFLQERDLVGGRSSIPNFRTLR
jgi:hypothetical protein